MAGALIQRRRTHLWRQTSSNGHAYLRRVARDHPAIVQMTEERGVVGAVDAGVVGETDRRGARLDQVQISKTAFAELADDVAEMRYSIAVAETAALPCGERRTATGSWPMS